MKDGVISSAPRTVTYLHGDHLGSASLATNASGAVVSQMRYKPYGELRWTSGADMPTDKRFTGQMATSYGTIFMSARTFSHLRSLSCNLTPPRPTNRRGNLDDRAGRRLNERRPT